MKRVVVLFFLAFFLCGCNKNLVKLDSKYYKESSFIEVNKDELNDLISKEESFMLFIYQPLCQTSYEFNTVVTRFSKEYQMTIYKIEFEDVKKTSLGEDIKYYPSFAIVNKGKLVDFLKSILMNVSGFLNRSSTCTAVLESRALIPVRGYSSLVKSISM